MAIKYTSNSRPIVHHHIILKPHHKKLIIGGSSLVFIFMITTSIFLYMMFVKQELNYNSLNNKITDSRKETQTAINSLANEIIQSEEEIESLSSNLGIINEEFGLLKASVGADFSGIIDQAVKSVVTIRTDVSQGTGFIINEEGFIVTNAHVLEGASSVIAINYEQDTISAEFIGYHSDLDIALLKIPGKYNVLELENSNNVQVGEEVIAIGNPLGLQFSASKGIVSGVHREGPNGLSAYIQTDAALNPGNSGGPLINKQGNVIGINNFKAGSSESLGFALESNYIKIAVNAISQKALNQTLI
ncbi:MAG: trypsin-like peptidase domain-containing protein [Nanoarchaeota archaeon]